MAGRPLSDRTVEKPIHSSKAIERKHSSNCNVSHQMNFKRTKLRDLDYAIGFSKGIKTSHSDSLMTEEAAISNHLSKDEDTSQITEVPASMVSDGLQVTSASNDLSLLKAAACLSLGHADSSHSTMNLEKSCPERVSGSSATSAFVSGGKKGTFQHKKTIEDLNLNIVAPLDLSLDLNAEDKSHISPFYPYKRLNNVKSGDPSECGSSTGPLEEDEPLRRWKEMKQNGFLSSFYGGISMHWQPGPPRKNKNKKKQAEHTKKEQANRFMKIAAPTGLLAGLNPGIINHVRNSKQVLSIIQAVVTSEKLDSQSQNRLPKSWNRPSIHSCSEQKCQDVESHEVERRVQCQPSIASHFASECGNDMLTLNLSSAMPVTSENASCVSNEESSASQGNITLLSLKAARIASQWLELLHHDIRGRLSALQRSRKRVRTVIEMEFPSHMLKDDEPYFGQLSVAECSQNATTDMHHVARWRSLFSQMENALSEEAKHLEQWLGQVQEMQLHCDHGLQYVNIPSKDYQYHPQPGSSEDSRSKKGEAFERECAILAAAASIYSTCNLVMTAKNASFC